MSTIQRYGAVRTIMDGWREGGGTLQVVVGARMVDSRALDLQSPPQLPPPSDLRQWCDQQRSVWDQRQWQRQ